MGNDRSKDKLKAEIREEVTCLFEKVLDYSQIACPPKVYKAFRSKVLRIGNDCIRNLESKVRHYDIEYVPQTEEIIEIINNK